MLIGLSNLFLGVLNLGVFLLIIIGGGIWLVDSARNPNCEDFLDIPAIVSIGAIILLLSIAGLVGACYRITWVLVVYLFGLSFLMLLVFAFMVFAFAVTEVGPGMVVYNSAYQGYRQHRIEDYSNWMQKRVKGSNWNKIKSCMYTSNLCKSIVSPDLYNQDPSSIQARCCSPPAACRYTFLNGTYWPVTSMNSTIYFPDCGRWNNQHNLLCYECDSCKAGFLSRLRQNLRRDAIGSVILIVFLIVVYLIGFVALRNNRDDYHRHDYEHRDGYCA